MPQTKPKPAASKAGRKPQRQYGYRPADVPAQARAIARDRLKDMLDEFYSRAWPEEHQFMLAILQNRDQSGASGSPRQHADFQPPIYTAVAEALENVYSHLVSVPDEDLVPMVEKYISELLRTKEQGALPPKEPWTRSAIRTRREEDLKETIATEFCKDASDDDMFFLEQVLYRWRDFLSYEKNEQPQSLVQSAFQLEIDREHYLVKVDTYKAPQVGALVKVMQGNSWLAGLLDWIGEKGLDNLSPCLIASKAAGMQEAWDKAQDEAA